RRTGIGCRESKVSGSGGIGARVHQRMDIVCAEAELMFSMYPTQILANLNTCRVRQAGNVPSLAAETERAGNTDADNPVRQIRRIHDVSELVTGKQRVFLASLIVDFSDG